MFHVKPEEAAKEDLEGMKFRKIGSALAAILVTGLLVACGQSTEALTENTEKGQNENTESETLKETEESERKVLTEEDAIAESEADNITEKAEDTSMTKLITPVRIYGVITDVWADQNTIVVDNQSEVSSPGEIELKIDTENTLVLDATTGYPVSLEEVQTGSFEAYLGEAMTMSLPPQTTPYMVIVNIPEDYGTPQYAIVEGIETDEDGGAAVTATDGRSYVLSADTQIVPYRTKNIVTIDDIQVGGKCLIWLNEEGVASKVQIFE